MRKKPGNLNKYVLEQINSMKEEITPFYFNHKSFEQPYQWFDDIRSELKNILVGYDTKEMKAIMTGRTTFDMSCQNLMSKCGSVTSFVSMDKIWPQKYDDIKKAIGYNTTLCLKLATCHQSQMRVSMKMCKIDKNP